MTDMAPPLGLSTDWDDPTLASIPDSTTDFTITPLQRRDEEEVRNLLRQNLTPFEEAGSVLAASFRRLDNLGAVYNGEGARMLIIKDPKNSRCLGCIGIGPLAGLPPEEGIGEIRDLVVDTTARKRGVGRQLLQLAVSVAQQMGYRRLYLETTPEMEKAQRLFTRFGFRPLKEGLGRKAAHSTLPCYYVLEMGT